MGAAESKPKSTKDSKKESSSKKTESKPKDSSKNSPVTKLYKKVKKGGLILCDDYINFKTVKQAVDFFVKKYNIKNGKTYRKKFYFIKI